MNTEKQIVLVLKGPPENPPVWLVTPIKWIAFLEIIYAPDTNKVPDGTKVFFTKEGSEQLGTPWAKVYAQRNYVLEQMGFA